MEVILKAAEVIVSFKKDGTLLPLRFRVITDDTGYETINVTRILRKRQEKVGRECHNIYTCTGLINMREKIFELKYDELLGSWTLYRI